MYNINDNSNVTQPTVKTFKKLRQSGVICKSVGILLVFYSHLQADFGGFPTLPNKNVSVSNTIF